MGRPPWISDRDLDPNYLLGPFDANRMLRLEGLQSARALGRAFVDLQRRFPTLWRNMQYVTSAEALRGGFMFAAIAQVGSAFADEDEELFARGRLLRPWHRPPVIGLGARFFSTREGEIQAGTDGDRPWHDPIVATPPHELAHVLHEELILSDALLGTHYHEDLNRAFRALLRSFQPGHVSSEEIDELRQYSALNGTGMLVDTFELAAELIRLAQLPREAIATEPRRLIDSVELMRDVLHHAWSPDVARQRHEALLAIAPPKWLMFDQAPGGSSLSEAKAAVLERPDSVTHWHHQYAGVYDQIVKHNTHSKDPRFAAMFTYYLNFEGAAVGLDQLQAVPHHQFANPEKRREFAAAVDTMTVNAGLPGAHATSVL